VTENPFSPDKPLADLPAAETTSDASPQAPPVDLSAISERGEKLRLCQERIGYHFRDESLLLEALTHASGAAHRLAGVGQVARGRRGERDFAALLVDVDDLRWRRRGEVRRRLLGRGVARTGVHAMLRSGRGDTARHACE
jgi:hypothetical protein